MSGFAGMPTAPQLPYPVGMDAATPRAFWLRVLLHLGGDIHQPLHCASSAPPSAAPRSPLLTRDLHRFVASIFFLSAVTACAPWANQPLGDSGVRAPRSPAKPARCCDVLVSSAHARPLLFIHTRRATPCPSPRRPSSCLPPTAPPPTCAHTSPLQRRHPFFLSL